VLLHGGEPAADLADAYPDLLAELGMSGRQPAGPGGLRGEPLPAHRQSAAVLAAIGDFVTTIVKPDSD